MLPATTRVGDFDRFMKIFSGAGAEKRKLHGSKGPIVFHDPRRPIESGWFSIGTSRDGRVSCPAPRSHRS
jgi:hypothetical protein